MLLCVSVCNGQTFGTDRFGIIPKKTTKINLFFLTEHQLALLRKQTRQALHNLHCF